MFDDMVVSSANPIKTNKPWTVAISMLIQFAVLAVLILIPLIYTEALPKTMMATMLMAPPPHHLRRHRLLRPPSSRSSRCTCWTPANW